MTSSAVSSPSRTGRAVALAAAGAVAWAALGALLIAGAAIPGLIIALVLIGVAATSLTIVRVVRSSPASRRTGLVVALLAPVIAMAAMTPLFALAGPLVFGIVALVLAAELVVLAVVVRGSGRRHG